MAAELAAWRAVAVGVVDCKGDAPIRGASSCSAAGRGPRRRPRSPADADAAIWSRRPGSRARGGRRRRVAQASQAADRTQGVPAEHGAVEGFGGLDITGVGAVEVQRAVLVDDPGALVLFGCQTQNTAPSGSANTPMRPASTTSNGSASVRPPAAPRLCGGIVRALDPYVGPPGRDRRGSGWDRADRGHVAAANPADEVGAGRPRRQQVLNSQPNSSE